jgi:hydrogenase maturation protease
MAEPPTRTLVLGVGNTLLGDEGVGVHALRFLQAQRLALDLDLVDGGTLGFSLAGVLAEAQQVVVIDAAQMSAPPGTVRRFVGEQMDRFLAGRRSRSVHEVSLYDLIAVGHLAGDLPQRRGLVAVQPEAIGWSEALSPEMEGALPRVAETVIALVREWGA